ncbi:MAG: tetratricopeptide repeat protein, partial [Parvularculaceae bacterium]
MAKRMTARGSRLARIAAALFLTTAAACASPEERVAKYTESGMAYLEKGDLGRANVQLQNALKINEEHVPALVGLSDISEKRQDFPGMFAILQRIIRLEPQNVDAQIKIGKVYLIGGDETAALESAEAALALAPESSDALALKAAVFLKLDNAPGAVELAKRALALDPLNTEA